MSKKKVIRARVKGSKESAVDRFLNLGYLLFNRYTLEFRGHTSLWFALISYKPNKYKDVFEYLEKMKVYDCSIKNLKRIKEVEEIEHLTEEDILQYGEDKYQNYWEQLEREVDQEKNKI